MKPIYSIVVLLLFFACKKKSSPEILKEDTIQTTKESSEAQTKNETLKKLQGTWVNIDAPLSKLSFNGNRVTNLYDGLDSKKNITFIISDGCGTKATKEIPKEKDRYIITSGDATECYYIVKLDAENLVLGFWGVETALRFKKPSLN